jgi:hypothetical protein
MMSKPKATTPKPATLRVPTPLPPETIPLERLALVYRTSDGAEQDRADGPMLAALLLGTTPADRARLFEPGDIAAEARGLAEMLAAMGDHDDTADHVSAALYAAEQNLLSLARRIEVFDGMKPPAAMVELYAVEIAPEVAS